MANIYDMSDVWNDGGTTFTSILMNVTDTASASDSLLMDLQVGGASKFSVAKDGPVSINSDGGIGLNFNPDLGGGRVTFITNGSSGAGGSFYIGGSGTTGTVGMSTGYSATVLRSNAYFGWVSGATINTTPDVRLYRDAANTLAQRNSTNAQTFNLYNTYTDASNYERGFMKWSGNELEIGTESLGTGGARSVGIYSNNVRYQIIGSNFNQFDKAVYMNAADIVTGGAGFKIGTATTQKIGFWNATPVVQPTTGISAGAFVANTSGISDDTATFDGYTIGQVVAALRQIGALA